MCGRWGRLLESDPYEAAAWALFSNAEGLRRRQPPEDRGGAPLARPADRGDARSRRHERGRGRRPIIGMHASEASGGPANRHISPGAGSPLSRTVPTGVEVRDIGSATPLWGERNPKKPLSRGGKCRAGRRNEGGESCQNPADTCTLHCGAQLRGQPGRFCARRPITGRKRCRLHGGLTPRGVSHHNYRGNPADWYAGRQGHETWDKPGRRRGWSERANGFIVTDACVSST